MAQKRYLNRHTWLVSCILATPGLSSIDTCNMFSVCVHSVGSQIGLRNYSSTPFFISRDVFFRRCTQVEHRFGAYLGCNSLNLSCVGEVSLLVSGIGWRPSFSPHFMAVYLNLSHTRLA